MIISNKYDNKTVAAKPTDYVALCKGILSECNASSNLTAKILKVVLEMKRELNLKSEQICSMTEDKINAKPTDNISSNKEILSKLEDISVTLKKKTYAQATSNIPNIKILKQPAVKKFNEGHILCLYPTTQNIKLSLIEVKKLLLPHLQKHPLNRIKDIRNDGILIELALKSSISEIAEILKSQLKDSIKILGDKVKRPQFIIKGISSDNSQREPDILIDQFKKLNNMDENADIRHKTFINLNSGDKHWIIETDGPTAKYLLKSERIYLEFSRHHISENFYVPVCTHCRGIGHSRKYCLKLDNIICLKCGADHTTGNCKEESMKCWLCHDQSNHKAGSKNCQAYINRLKQTVNAVSYK